MESVILQLDGAQCEAWACMTQSGRVALCQVCDTEHEAWRLAEAYREQVGTLPTVAKVLVSVATDPPLLGTAYA